ncbi:hypothetical protein JFT95_26545 [Bacillus sp. TH17]|uniref:hypothetical protein n=1 Tax=Bacillus sp. TH17 TaxID=2796383 RepID=UPI001913A50A|nr:hypothetical protein [Bacillus sp. TH17]MBK5490915.1 hypothetical protein [Bacillus sp. TH17]
MRVPMKLNRITVLALNKFKQIKYDDPDINVTTGHVLSVAYELIEPSIQEIDWKTVNKMNIPNVTNNNDESIMKVNTTLNLAESVVKGIEALQQHFRKVYDTDRVFKTFVVKLILFAAILQNEENLPLLEKNDED